MSTLILKKRGTLNLVQGNTSDGISTDVTDSIDEYLLEAIELDNDLTLRDIFQLIQKTELLQRIFKHFYLDEFLEDLEKIPMNSGRHEALITLSIFWQANFDQNTDKYYLIYKPIMFVACYPPTVDFGKFDMDGDIILSSTRAFNFSELIDLPIIYYPNLILPPTPSDFNMHVFLNLLELIKGILATLTIFGNREQRESERAKIILGMSSHFSGETKGNA